MSDVLYSHDEAGEFLTAESAEEAVEQMCTNYNFEDIPDVAHIYAFQRVVVPSSAHRGLIEAALESVFEYLDDEYGGEEASTPANADWDAATAFVESVLSRYVPWRCDPAPHLDEWIPTALVLGDLG